jgi:hypothetical protein
MKRFTIKAKVEKFVSEFEFGTRFRGVSFVEEHAQGEWVRWSDVEALREYLESQIPERRIAKLERALKLVSSGNCPECEQRVRDYQPPLGSFAPEAFAAMREAGIDPCTGHKASCSLKGG